MESELTELLDRETRYRASDPSGFGGRIASLPTQCADAWLKGLSYPLPDSFSSADTILVLGMGGSAIVGDLLQGLLAFHGGVPVSVHRGYRTGRVNQGTLVIVSSYSGETEETLSAFESAWRPGSKALAVTRGGSLAAECGRKGVPVFPIELKAEPRNACGSMLFGVLGGLQRLGLTPDRSDEVLATIATLRELHKRIEPSVSSVLNPAKQLAIQLLGMVAVVCGAEHLTGVARRWKTQIAENAHEWAFYEELPEHGHNSIERAGPPLPVAHSMVHVLLASTLYHPRVRLRYALTHGMLADEGFQCEMLELPGNNPLAEMMAGVLFGDYVSYYLCILKGVDPAITPKLDRLKTKMANG